MGTETKEEDRLFVRDGWRHYRRTYSVTEVRWGLVTGAIMLLIAGWVVWKGAHPDPALFSDGTALLKTENRTALPKATETVPLAGREAEAAAGSRGPLPAALAGTGWREEKIAEFDPENLYVKIDGRADFFKAFGFKRLYSVLLVSAKDPATTVDIEMYDLGKSANALGAYNGERSPTAVPEVSDSGLQHVERNALYLARGPYYVRVIGSDETPAIAEKLKALAATLVAGIKGEPLPWAYRLFVGMGLDPGQIAYSAENAFSFGFARDIWTVRPAGKDNDLEVFVAARKDAATARALGAQFRKGFLELGLAGGKVGTVPLAKDRFLGTLAAVDTKDRYVLGVRGAAGKDVVAKELARLAEGLAKTPAPAVIDDPERKGEGVSDDH